MKKVLAWVFIVLFTLTTGADLLLTWQGSPDLTREANFLIKDLGFGWPMLLGVNLLVLLLYAFLVYYAYVTYGKKRNAFRHGGGKPPSYTLALLGFTFSVSMLVARLLVVAQWWVTDHPDQSSSWLKALVSWFPNGRADLMLVGVLGLVSAVVWTVGQYLEERAYQSAVN